MDTSEGRFSRCAVRKFAMGTDVLEYVCPIFAHACTAADPQLALCASKEFYLVMSSIAEYIPR